MFVTSALAQTAQTMPQSGGADLMSIVMQFVVILAILYFVLIRPQQKKVKKQMQMLNAIQSGDKVSISGILGTVVKVHENELTVRIAPETEIQVLRYYISDVLENEKELKKEDK